MEPKKEKKSVKKVRVVKSARTKPVEAKEDHEVNRGDTEAENWRKRSRDDSDSSGIENEEVPEWEETTVEKWEQGSGVREILKKY
jgi:hypothetical protein